MGQAVRHGTKRGNGAQTGPTTFRALQSIRSQHHPRSFRTRPVYRIYVRKNIPALLRPTIVSFVSNTRTAKLPRSVVSRSITQPELTIYVYPHSGTKCNNFDTSDVSVATTTPVRTYLGHIALSISFVDWCAVVRNMAYVNAPPAVLKHTLGRRCISAQLQ